MKLVAKLTFTLSIAMVLVLGAYALTTALGQLELFRADKEYDGRLVGHSVAAAVAAEIELRGLAAGKRLVSDANLRDPDISIRWVDLTPEAPSRYRPATDVSLPSLELAGQLTVAGTGPEGVASILTYTTLPDVAPRGTAIEVAQDLTDQDAFVRETLWRAGISLLIIILASAVVASVTGSYLVGRPVNALLDKAKEITKGNFLSELRLNRRDELGDIGKALVEAGEELERKRLQVECEHEERLQAESQLRHAERLATVGKLASGVAHELGTPLNVVSGHAGLIENNEQSPERCRESARVIHRQIERISKIIRDLLDFARQSGRADRSNEDVDLVALCRTTLTLVETMTLAKGVEISVAAPLEPLRVVGDPSLIQQVVMNICVNALQALGGRGSLSLEVSSTRATNPDAVGASEREVVCVSIIDDGPGIHEGDLDHIFEPFFTTKDVGKGTGLGLSMVYGIVRDHGGWVEVQSQLGNGARFDIYLPLGETTPAR